MSVTDRYTVTHYRWVIVFGKSRTVHTSTDVFRTAERARESMEREIQAITLAMPIVFAAVTVHRNFTEEECQ